MQKFITKIIVATTIFLTFNQTTSWGAFTDVTTSNKNYNAIIYLQENNIINGYEDGTFKPLNEINRAEFLKIIIEGSGITLDSYEDAPFSDVDNYSWYAPYVKKAYTEGWVVGYADGTFKPGQTITKAEALKILGEVQNWELPTELSTAPFSDISVSDWFATYISYAKDNNYLEETGEIFSPNNLMTRGKISEIIYRTLTNEPQQNENPDSENPDNENNDSENPPIQPVDDQEDLTFDPVSYSEISTNYFVNISLDTPIPNTFYKNETFVIKGKITSTTNTLATVFINSTDNNDSTKIFTEKTQNNNFEIPVHFDKSGNYEMGIIPGEDGESKIAEISVLPNLPESQTENTPPEKANSLSASFKDNKTNINFNAQDSTIKKIKLFQDDKLVTYITRQNVDSVNIEYKDFENFKEEENVHYSVETAKISSENPLEISSIFSESDTKEFTATEHTFDQIIDASITVDPPDTHSLSQISFSGTLNVNTQSSIYVINTDGFVEKSELSTNGAEGTYFGTPIIEKGATFTFTYTPEKEGRYIIEIVDQTGIPILNHPIYVGESIPLIPDYFDVNKREYFSGEFDLDELREELLNEINKSREEHGLSDLTTRTDLNDLAQAHSEDMAENNYFAHVDTTNKTQEDRRIDAGIKTIVSENIAKDTSIKFAHLGLMRSATHRSNILNENWTSVGLGIALDEEQNYLLVTEEFSISEITQADLDEYKTELTNEINNKRSEEQLNTLIYDSNLEAASKDLNTQVITENITITNSIFENILETYSISGTSQTLGRTSAAWTKILESILENEPSIVEEQWEKIGIDIQTNEKGIINVILIINSN